jgi:para-nitrobenzyl esterase
MMWIYGGGFQFGSSAMPNYDGAALSELGIVVTFNYQLVMISEYLRY